MGWIPFGVRYCVLNIENIVCISSSTMPRIEKLTVSWNGLLKAISEVVQLWAPPKLKGETAYRDHLIEHLRASLPEDAKIEKEFRHRGTTMDIWLGWKGLVSNDELGFELKLNLKRKTDFDRLVGQIEGMEPRKSKILVVLMGETDKALLGRLKEKYAPQMDDMEPTLAIVLVGVGK